MFMKEIFKVGDKVFDSVNYPDVEGEVVAISEDDLDYPVKVKFGDMTEYYRHDGRRLTDYNPTLSFTPYKLEGFTQEKTINYGDYIGKYGFFWNDNQDVVDRLYGRLDGVGSRFEDRLGNYWKYFLPFHNEELLNKLKLK